MTSAGNFYVSISAGMLTAEGLAFFAISLASPIGQKMKGLKAAESFSLNGKNYMIKEIR